MTRQSLAFRPSAPDATAVRTFDLLAGLSYGLDLAEGQRAGHAVRTCIIGMHLADALSVPPDQRPALFDALLMKDLGSSATATGWTSLFGTSDQRLKSDFRAIDWSQPSVVFDFVVKHVDPEGSPLRRAWRAVALLSQGPDGPRNLACAKADAGAGFALRMGLDPASAESIRAVGEHWDGSGHPAGLKGTGIPLFARIAGLAQAVDATFTAQGALAAYDMATARTGTWFDPDVVSALYGVPLNGDLGWRLDSPNDLQLLRTLMPARHDGQAVDADIDRVVDTFATVIDAKSPWSVNHSTSVADLSVAMGLRLGLYGRPLCTLRRAALLHDLGKLGVPNVVLDKPGPLTRDELTIMRRHIEDTSDVLDRVPGFDDVARIAGGHHERLDGSGYHQRRRGSALDLSTRILCVADICDALRASRPYRARLDDERVLEVMKRDVGTGLDASCYAALREVLQHSPLGDVPAAMPVPHIVPSLGDDYWQAA